VAGSDPRQLLIVVDALTQSIERWLYSFASAEENVRRGLQDAQDAGRQLLDQTRQAREAVEDLQSRTAAATERVDVTRSDSDKALALAQKADRRALDAIGRGQTRLAEWQAGLARAEESLALAQRLLAEAQRQLAAAQAMLAAAQYELSSAGSALTACLSSYTVDQQGNRHYRNCSGERARVERAQAAVHAAQHEVAVARTRVDMAAARVARARAVVQRCQAGLDKAGRLLTDARANRLLTGDALQLGLEAHAVADQAAHRLQLAADEVAHLDQLAGQAESFAASTADLIAAAADQLPALAAHLQEHQEQGAQGRLDLELTELQLRQFDRADGL